MNINDNDFFNCQRFKCRLLKYVCVTRQSATKYHVGSQKDQNIFEQCQNCQQGLQIKKEASNMAEEKKKQTKKPMEKKLKDVKPMPKRQDICKNSLLKSLRPFSRWAAGQIELCCQRNDYKPAWEATHPDRLKAKITEEYNEVMEALAMEPIDPAHVQWELTDLAATCFMLSAHFDAEMSHLNRGKIV
jgi:hypothetical protein